VLIAKYGQIFFVEANPVVLHGEIGATVVIILFGLAVFVLQCKRLGERRGDDDRERGKQG
jgi:hypothetical protein